MRSSVRSLWASVCRIGQLVRKEFWQYRTDKVFTFLVLSLPVVQLLLVAGALGDDGGMGQPIAVVDQDHSPTSRQLVRALENSQEVQARLYPAGMEEGDRALRQGEAEALLVIPPHFERDLYGPGTPPELLAVADGTNAWIAAEMMQTIQGTVDRFVRSSFQNQGRSSGLELRRVDYFEVNAQEDGVSSQLGFMLYQIVLVVAVLGITRERETGTLEQLLVTPLTRFELIAGKTVPSLILGCLDFFVLHLVSTGHYGVPMRGSLGLLLGVALLFMLAESAWGLWLSSWLANQQQAMQTLFVQVLVDMAFCGYIVPVHNLPWFLRWISELLPLRHYLHCVRAVMLRGAGLSAIGPHIAALVLMNLVFWSISVQAVRRIE